MAQKTPAKPGCVEDPELISLLTKKVFEATGLGVIITGPLEADTPIIYVNDGFRGITGYSLSESLGRNPRFLQGQGTDQTRVEPLRQAIRSGSEGRAVLRNYRRDGTEFWNEMTISPVRGDSGQVTHYVGIVADITEIKETQDENARLVRELRQASLWQQSFLHDVLLNVTEGHLHLCASPADLPKRVSPCDPPVTLSEETMSGLRHRAMEMAQRTGIPQERSFDLQIAAGEAMMNAIVHAGGGKAEICAEPNNKAQVWVLDHGPGIGLNNLHRATLERGYTTKGTLGHGFKLMLICSDRIYLCTDTSGTTVCIEQDVNPANIRWPW